MPRNRSNIFSILISSKLCCISLLAICALDNHALAVDCYEKFTGCSFFISNTEKVDDRASMAVKDNKWEITSSSVTATPAQYPTNIPRKPPNNSEDNLVYSALKYTSTTCKGSNGKDRRSDNKAKNNSEGVQSTSGYCGTTTNAILIDYKVTYLVVGGPAKDWTYTAIISTREAFREDCGQPAGSKCSGL